MAERTDHLSGLRAGTVNETTPDPDAPTVSRDLVEYLEEKGYGKFDPSGWMVSGLDSSVAIQADVMRVKGQLQVLQFLRNMIRNQQG